MIVKHTQNCTKRLKFGTISVSNFCSSISIFCFINFVNSSAGRGVELVLTGGSSELSGPRRVSIEELNAATKNFSSINLIGHGTFGEVYKGLLHDGTVVAIKRRPSGPNEAFVQEVFTRFFFLYSKSGMSITTINSFSFAYLISNISVSSFFIAGCGMCLVGGSSTNYQTTTGLADTSHRLFVFTRFLGHYWWCLHSYRVHTRLEHGLVTCLGTIPGMILRT